MPTVTLESLAQRLDVVEKAIARLAAPNRPKDWRRVVGMFSDNEFMKRVILEGREIRDADRKIAEQESQDR